jgi:hypothetical protein
MWAAGPGCASRICWTGSSGVIIGLDPAPEMLRWPRAKLDVHGWTGVHLIEASAEEANIPGLVDADLFSAVHDVLQSPTALDNVFGTCVPERLWPPWVVSGRRPGSSRCTSGCTRATSVTSPASTGRGGCSNDGSTGSTSPRWRSGPATS